MSDIFSPVMARSSIFCFKFVQSPMGQIAFNTFVNGEYFFRQEDLQRQIKDYICNLPEASADPEVLRLDSEVVLKAIEHHHGLLVERARNIYSFSHLTFQEYFAAREIERERHFEILMQHITDPQWKEVFILTAEMLRRSDDFVKMIKDRVDKVERDEKMQAFIEWVDQKTNSVKVSCKTVAVKAFYAHFEASGLALPLGLNSVRFDALKYRIDRDHNIEHIRDLIIDYALNRLFSEILEDDLVERTLFLGNDYQCLLKLKKIDRNINLYLGIAFDIGDDVLRQALQAFNSQLPTDQEEFYQWWENHGEKWTRELRQVCIDCRNIGHDWQFTKGQAELLKQYYEVNLLLVECMNRSYVSKQVREEIESTMLLPSKK
jgi:predicted NACHT family NTPase